MRSHLGTPFRNVSDQSPGPGYVHCRLLTLDRNIPYRTINPLDVADNHSGRYFPDFAGMCIPYMLIIWKLVPETTGKALKKSRRIGSSNHRSTDERYIDKLLFTYVFKLCDNRKMIGQQRLNSLSSYQPPPLLGRA